MKPTVSIPTKASLGDWAFIYSMTLAFLKTLLAFSWGKALHFLRNTRNSVL